jgi:phosphoacetylglucosamine mutase
MITASHNKYTDNGIKIAAEDGSSLSNEWENIYSDIINSKNLYQDLINLNKNIGLTVGETFYNKSTPIINVAYDTRRSSEGLCKILCDCLKIINAKFNLYGLLTTPGLHFLTLINQLAFKNVKYNLDKFYFAPTETYWNFLQGGFKAFNIFYEKFYNSSNNLSSNEDMKYQNEILLDCGSGLAGFVSNNIANIVGDYLKISFINIDFLDYKNLNNLCGAEYVHKEKKIPINYKLDCKISKNLSFDGDVDRIIYL